MQTLSEKKKKLLAKPRLVDEGAWERKVKIPLTEVEDLVVKSSPEDVAWSFALRIFRCFSEDIQDAIWALLKKPDASILKAIHTLLTMAITRKIMTSGIRVTADLDLVETDDVIMIESDNVPLIGKVALLLHDMRELPFEEQVINVKVKDEKELVPVVNKTWMTQSLVESMILSLQHSKLAVEMEFDQAMIGNILKTGEKLLPAVFDFFLEEVSVFFDEKLLLMPVYGVTSDFSGKLSAYASTMERFEFRPDVTGTMPRTINFVKFKAFLQDCNLVDKNFSSIMFCYLYPQAAKDIFDLYIGHVQDDDFLVHGAPAMESWVSCAIASKTVNGADFKYTDSEIEEEELSTRLTSLSEIDMHMEEMVDINRSEISVAYKHIDPEYVGTAEELMDFSDRDSIKQLNGSKFKGIPTTALTELSIKHSRMVRAMAFGETLRVARLGGYDGSADAETNQLADMFPDQYKVFYHDMLVDGLVIPGVDESYSVTNSSFMEGCFNTRYQGEGHSVMRKFTVADTFVAYEKEGAGILMLDLNGGIFSSIDRDVGRFAKTWASPILADDREIGSALRQVLVYMGSEDVRSDEILTAWIRLPVLTDFSNFLLLYRILCSMTHRVSVLYPKGMHEPYFDLKIYPIVYKKASISEQVDAILARTLTITNYAMCFFDHFTVHLYEGIKNRHVIYECALTGVYYRWKSNRYKLLANLDFKVVIDIERVKHVRQIVTQESGRRVRRDNARKRAKAMKHGVAAHQARADKVLSQFRMGVRAGGMRDVSKK